jgi:hypothetical protein
MTALSASKALIEIAGGHGLLVLSAEFVDSSSARFGLGRRQRLSLLPILRLTTRESPGNDDSRENGMNSAND